MNQEQQLKPAIEAFIKRDYAFCGSQAERIFGQSASLMAAHLIHTSQQRRGGLDQARGRLSGLVAKLPDRWDQAMLRLGAGEGSASDAAARPATDLQCRQQQYYGIAALVTQRRRKEARDAFMSMLMGGSIAASCIESYLMVVEHNYLADGSSGTDLDKSVIELNEQTAKAFNANDLGRAQQLAERAQTEAQRSLGDLHPAYINAVRHLGIVYHASGQQSKARPLLEQSAKLLRLAAGPDDPTYADAIVILAMNYLHQMPKFKKAAELGEEAVKIYSKTVPSGDKRIADARELVDTARQAEGKLFKATAPMSASNPSAAAAFSWAGLFKRGDGNTGAVRDTYGFRAEDPIMVDQPLGELQFIGTLRCPSGHRMRGHRAGSLGGKCPDASSHRSQFPASGRGECTVDRYELRCDGSEHSCTLYFDMYHPNMPPQPAPKGLTRTARE
jgi:hypothetical protein